MKSKNLLIAAIVLAALSGGVWWAKRHPETATSGASSSTPASPKLADIPDAQITSIQVQKKDGPVIQVERSGGKWAIVSPDKLSADQDAANGMATSLSPMTGDSVVEEKASDLSTFGLNAPSLIVTVSEKGGKSEKILFGDNVPAGSLVYASVGSSPKVYSVSSSVKSSFDKSLNDLRDKRLLTFDSNKLTAIDLIAGKTNVEFAKNNQNEWQIVKPQPYRADSFQVEELLRKLTDAKMDFSGGADVAQKADAAFASGMNVGTAKTTDSSGTQTLDVHKKGDDYYARSSVAKGAYKVAADLGKQMEKPLDDFRNKKIFDFGFNDPTRIDVTSGDKTQSLVRSGSDWKINGQTMDAGQVQALIDKLRDLAATQFETGGFGAPTLTVKVVSNDGKRTETASFSKSADSYLAEREAEHTVYKLTAKSVDDILEASKAIKPAAQAKK